MEPLLYSSMEFSRRFVLLKDVLLKAGTPKYRLEQLTRQLYAGKTTVSDLKALGTQAKNAIETHFGPDLLTLRCVSVSEAPRARKILFECKDGVRIEAVALKFASHTSLCISSQVGTFLELGIVFSFRICSLQFRKEWLYG